MMELKRLLDRANVLLLQGAYQGAESFIEQAMAEADKLKSELAELDTLRTRVTEIASEVERLQSVIDEANAQEPVIRVRDGRVVDFNPNYDGDVSNGEFFARPIPAQQSPVVAVPDSDGVSIIEAALKKVSSGNLAEAPFPLIGENAQCYLNGAASAYQHALEMLCVSSPRITEQDAYDIVLNFYWYMEAFKNRHGKNPSVIEWRDAEGRSLLNKLNGDQNGK